MKNHNLWRFLTIAVFVFACSSVCDPRLTYADDNYASVDLRVENRQSLTISESIQKGLDVGEELTIQAWIRKNSSDVIDQVIVGKYDGDAGSGARSYALSINATGPDQINLLVSDGTSHEWLSVPKKIDSGEWHNIAVTYTGGTAMAKFFLDGSLVGEVESTIHLVHDSNVPFRIGATSVGSGIGGYFDGRIDEVRVWSVARTEEEIQRDMRRVLTGNEPGLEGYWRMEGNFLDSSSNGNHLTPENGPTFSDDVPFLGEDESELEQPDTISASEDLLDGLVSYWPMDEESGVREDVHGGNDVNPQGIVSVEQGIVATSARLERMNKESFEIEDEEQAGLEPAQISVSLWMKSTLSSADNGDASIVSKRSADGYQISLQDWGRLWWQINGQYMCTNQMSCGGEVLEEKNDLDDDQWHHVVATYDGQTGRLFLDGNIVASKAWGSLQYDNADPFYIGQITGTHFFDGSIDEVGLWDRALTEGEVAMLYNGGKGLAYGSDGSIPDDAISSVAFLPGIMGSRLYEDTTDGEHKVWESVFAGDIGTLAMREDGTSRNPALYTRDVIDEIRPVEGLGSFGESYAGWVDFMDGLVREGKVKEWKVLPYDWRLATDELFLKGKELGDGKVSYLEDASPSPQPSPAGRGSATGDATPDFVSSEGEGSATDETNLNLISLEEEGGGNVGYLGDASPSPQPSPAGRGSAEGGATSNLVLSEGEETTPSPQISPSEGEGGLPYMLKVLKELADGSPTGKVTIVAHSNGGLVAKNLIRYLETTNDPLLEKIDTLVLVASPQAGTPKALREMLHGMDMPAQQTLRDVVKNMPGAYGLLPSPHLMTLLDEPVVEVSSSVQTLPLLQDMAGKHITSYDDLRKFLTGEIGVRSSAATIGYLHPNLLNATLLTSGSAMHEGVDEWEAPEGIRVVEVVGTGLWTPRGISYSAYDRRTGSGTTLKSLRTEWLANMLGDGTVLARSAESGVADETYYLAMSEYNTFAQENHAHGDILSAAPVQVLIEDVVLGGTDAVPLYMNTTGVTAPFPRFELRAYSPVDLHLYAEGKHTGVADEPATGLGRYVEEEVPNSEYEEWADVKYLTGGIEEDAEVRVVGTGDGRFSLALTLSDAGDGSGTYAWDDLPVRTTSRGTMRMRAGEEPVLAYDFDGDGDVDRELRAGETFEPWMSYEVSFKGLREAIRDAEMSRLLETWFLSRVTLAEQLYKKGGKGNVTAAKVLLETVAWSAEKQAGKALDAEEAETIAKLARTVGAGLQVR